MIFFLLSQKHIIQCFWPPFWLNHYILINNIHTKDHFYPHMARPPQFSNKNVRIWDHFFPLRFPKDSESLKILDIRLREVGAKRQLNGTSKVNTQTDTRTDGRIFWLIESIGPEGRCFENHYISTYIFKLGTQGGATLQLSWTSKTNPCSLTSSLK